MKTKHLYFFLPALALFFTASAQAGAYQIDQDHSQVGFQIRHLVGKVKGHFAQFEGDITIDDKKISNSKFLAKIKTASIDTNSKKRDDHLKGTDFFDVDQFPLITFESTKISGSSKNMMIDGNLTIRGVTKPVKLKATHNGTGTDPWGNERIGLSATGKINRKDFGMNWNKALDKGGVMLGDDVDLTIEVEGIAKK